MTRKPAVSFIMGVYRCKSAEDLRACVESVIAQTYQDWEFLIVDDGSVDDGATWAAIKAAAALDSRVIPLRYEVNRGLAYALDYCLERASGTYIARQDDDDLSQPERLVKEIAFLEAHPEIDLVGTNAVVFDEKGSWGSFVRPSNPTREDFLWGSPFIHPSILVRADSLRAVGGYRVASETILYEDYDLFMRMYLAGMRGHNLQEPLYRYRQSRITSKPRNMSARIREFKVRKRGFKELGLGIRGVPYMLKPILLGLVPRVAYGVIQGRRTAS